MNASSGQVEYLNESACDFFLTGPITDYIQPETGIIKRENSRLIIERLLQAFYPEGSSADEDPAKPTIARLYERLKDTGVMQVKV